MAANEHLSDYQFSLIPAQERSKYARTRHKVVAETDTGDYVGELEWHSRSDNRISNLFVEANHRREGVATGMWNYAHEMAKTTKGVKPPTHSSDRTDEGDAWAKATGGPVPKRTANTYVTHNWETE